MSSAGQNEGHQCVHTERTNFIPIRPEADIGSEARLIFSLVWPIFVGMKDIVWEQRLYNVAMILDARLWGRSGTNKDRKKGEEEGGDAGEPVESRWSPHSADLVVFCV